MFTDEATRILRRADPEFRFGRDDMDPGRSRCIEVPVWHRGRCVGHLEHNEMPDRRPVVECFGKYGMPYSDARKREGHRPYRRDSWQACFREIMGQVGARVQQAIRKLLRKAGYRL